MDDFMTNVTVEELEEMYLYEDYMLYTDMLNDEFEKEY